MNEQHLIDAAVRTLRDPATIRARCASISLASSATDTTRARSRDTSKLHMDKHYFI